MTSRQTRSYSRAITTASVAILWFLSLVAAQSTTSLTAAPSSAVATPSSVPPTASSPSSSPLPTCVAPYDCSTSPKGCLNNGVCEQGVCKCRQSFGGIDCGLLTCGSPLTDASQRLTTPPGGSCSNKCDDGFGGFNCNVCKTDAGCQSKRPTRPSFLGDEKMVCNSGPESYYNTFMSCAVRAPELITFFPGNYTINLDLDVVNKTVYAQFWLGQSEQFYCTTTNCSISTSILEGTNITRNRWDCPTLECRCITPTALCGGLPGPPITLGDAVNGIKGPFSLECPDNSDQCSFFIGDLSGIFPKGLMMVDCVRGECVFPSEIISSSELLKSQRINPGTIAGLAIVGILVLLLLVVCGLVKRSQVLIRQLPYTLSTEAASLEFRDIGYVLNKDMVPTIKNISGAAPAGVVLAVMGPSGAGKSTLVDILAGKRKDGTVSGRIILNGKHVHESEIRRVVGFVDQEDTLPATQTVWEAVLFSAMLRLPESMPALRKHERVSEVIEMLGLTHCKDRRIGNITSRGISGGEKRRVSIAIELITRPPILILDEPTSGLDSYSAHMVVQQLCKLAQSKTTTVILTIHQPRSDIFFMFDQTLVISKGETLYLGPPSEAADYLARRNLVCPSNYNIADYLLDVAMDEEMIKKAMVSMEHESEKMGLSTSHQARLPGNNLLHRQPNGSSGTRSANDPNETSVRMEDVELSNSTESLTDGSISKAQPRKSKTVYPTCFLTQLQVIMKRHFQTLIRDKSLLVLHIVVSITLGLLIGGLYFQAPMTLAGFQNRAGSLFFMLALLGFSSISALGAFTDSRTLFIKERSNGYYPPTPYILSTLLFDLIPLRVVPALCLGTISYFMIGLTAEAEAFLKFLLILVLFNISTAMFCLVIAAGVRSTGVASLASSIAMLFMMLFGGFMINQGKIPAALTWIQYLSMFKYGFESLAVNEIARTSLVDNIQGVSFNVPGSLILQKLFGFSLSSYWKNVIVLFIFNVLYVAIFWVIVSLRLKERK